MYVQNYHVSTTLSKYTEYAAKYSSALKKAWIYHNNWIMPESQITQPHDNNIKTQNTTLQEILTGLRKRVDQRLKDAREYREQEVKLLNLDRYCQGKYITVGESGGRLGNLLFQIASLLGISKKLNLQPYWMLTDQRLFVFEGYWIPFPASKDEQNKTCLRNQHNNFTHQGESAKGGLTFTMDLHNQSIIPQPMLKPIMLHGFLQSWRYFGDYRKEVRKMLTFKQEFYHTALQVMEKAFQAYFTRKGPAFIGNPEIVGIHVRRGDYVGDAYVQTASESYLLDRVGEFRRKYPVVIFFIISDTVEYCRKVFQGDDIVVVESYLPEVHMAILSFSDHIIMSMGSFSWWTAYLSDAKTVTYYKDWLIHPGLKNQKPEMDHFMPTWVGANRRKKREVFELSSVNKDYVLPQWILA